MGDSKHRHSLHPPSDFNPNSPRLLRAVRSKSHRHWLLSCLELYPLPQSRIQKTLALVIIF